MEHRIVFLPKEMWRDHVVPICYTTNEYYDVAAERRSDRFSG